MILINVKFKPLPEYVETFREKVAEFTDATRSEPGCLWFEWFRNTDNPAEYFLVEAFEEDAAEAHVNGEHFKKACEMFPTLLKERAAIINTTIEGNTPSDRMSQLSIE